MIRSPPVNRKWTVLAALAALSSAILHADPPVTVRPIRNIAEVRNLSYEQSRTAPPVQFRVTVISHPPAGFDGQDNTGGLFFEIDDERMPDIGEELEISGNVTGGFYGPYVIVDEIVKRGRKNPPRALNFRPDFVQTGVADNRWVEIEGLLVDVNFDEEEKRKGEGLLVTGQSDLSVRFRNEKRDFDVNKLEKAVGSWVKLSGSGAPLFNDQRQRIGSDIICPSHQFVEVIDQSKETETVPLDEIGRWDSRRTRQALVQTEGIVTFVENSQSVIVQSGEHGARVRLLSPENLTVGAPISVLGLPETNGYFVGLHYAKTVPMEDAEMEELVATPDKTPLSRDNAFQLVTIAGRLIEKGRSLLNLQVEDALVPVSLPSGVTPDSLPPEGSELRIEGVKMVDADGSGLVRSVTIALRSPKGIEILAVPSWWTPTKYLIAISLLLAGVMLFLFWSLSLKKRVKKQTHLIESQLVSNAALEERNRIARELHDTLSQGFSGVGYQLASVANHLETDPDKARNKLETARQMVEHSLIEARESLTGLRVPSAADSLQFPVTTIAVARERCDEAEMNFYVHHTLELDPEKFEPETAYACHRILLEAVMNAIRHSGGDSVGFASGATEEELIFCISDNGHGFDPEVTPIGHFGIQGMQERAKQIDAGLTVETSSEGTRLLLTLLRNRL